MDLPSHICSVISAAYSVNVCDTRHSSSALVACAKHLLHSFCPVVQSCGINILPAAHSLIISLVYQLEWSSQFARAHPSKDSLTYKLAVYRCLSSILEATAHVASSVLPRVASRIISEVCFDISYAARGSLTQSLMNAEANLANYELQICCAVAATRLIDIFFVNHSFVLTHSLSEDTGSLAKSNGNFCDYKFKQALLTLSSEIHNLGMRLVELLKKSGKLTLMEQALVKPHFILPFLNAAAVVQDYGFLFSRSNALHELTKVLLTHRDTLIRTNAERCFRHTFKPFSSTKLDFSNGNYSVSSFTQTEQLLESSASIEVLDDLASSESKPDDKQKISEHTEVSMEVASVSCSMEANNEMPQETGRPSILRQSAAEDKNPSLSKGRGKKRVRFEDSPSITAKKACHDTAAPEAEENLYAQEEPTPAANSPPREDGSVSIEDALSTFDDTLI